MSAPVDETAVMLGLTLMLERGLLNSSDRAWTSQTLARRAAAGYLDASILHAGATLLHRHRALATEHGIPVPELPAATGTAEATSPLPSKPTGPRVEVTVASTGELMVTGSPVEMATVWKSLPGHRWHSPTKAWYFTPAPAVAAAAGNAVRAHNCTLAMGPKARAMAVEHTRRRERTALLDPSAEVPDIDWARHITRQPWEHQLRMAQFQVDSSASLAAVPMGGGKHLAVDTPIATPSGWTAMGDLVEGDIVFDERGEPCRVVEAHPVHTDLPCYEVEFSDGEVIVASGEHLWFTETRRDREHRSEVARGRVRSTREYGGVRTTEEIARTLHVGARSLTNHSIPVAGALRLDDDPDLPVPPYLLGQWLGNGSTHTGGLTTGGLAGTDGDGPEIRETIAAEGYECGPSSDKRRHVQTFTVRGLIRDLRAAGVLHEKHIPVRYLRASEKQRRALLAGLLDTDGTVCGHGRVQFDSTRHALAEGVRELVCSLGYRPSWQNHRAVCDGVDYGPSYRVSFTTADPLFRLSRKADAHAGRSAAHQPERNRHRYIVAARPVEPVPVRCISVNSAARLYLAGRAMIPTHNTAATILALNMTSATRVLTVCPNKVRGVWGRELGKHSTRPWHVVDGRRESRRARAGFVDLQVPDRIRELEETLFDCDCGRPHMAAVNYEVLTHEMWDGWAPRERFDWVVYDEVHRLKSHAMRTKGRGLSVSGRAAAWVQLADRRTGLSGTPLSTDPAEDAFSIYRALDPGIFGTLWTQHDAHYRIKNPQIASHVIGYRNLAELARKIALIMYRPQVQLDLPPAVSETVEVELDASTMRAYREMETELVTDLREFIDPASVQAAAAERDRKAANIWKRGADEAKRLGLTGQAARDHAGKVSRAVMHAGGSELDEDDPETELTAANPMVKLLRCQQLTGGVLATDDGVEARVWDTGNDGRKPSPKGEALSTVLADVGCTPERLRWSALANHGKGAYVGVDPEPVVVMCRFSSDLAQVREIAEARGLRYGEISGNRTDGLTRDSLLSPDVDVCGVQIQAGGTGIELVRSRIVVWWSVGYSLVDFDQAMKRVHRPGQTRPVLNVFLVAKGTADEAVYEALDGRRSTVASVYRLAGFTPDQVDSLTAGTAGLDGERADGLDDDAPAAPELRSDARAGEVVTDLPWLDAGAGLTDAPVYKPRRSRRRGGAPTKPDAPRGGAYTSRADEVDALQEAMFE